MLIGYSTMSTLTKNGLAVHNFTHQCVPTVFMRYVYCVVMAEY